MDTTRKVLALLRVSTKEQDMERQKTDIDFNCQRFDLRVVNTYAFDGVTGVIVQNKPELEECLERWG